MPYCCAASCFHQNTSRYVGAFSTTEGNLADVLQRLSKLVRVIAGAKCGEAGQCRRPDVAAAAAAVGLLVAQQPAARAGLLQLRGLKPLLALLHQGSLAEQSVAANVLFDMSQGTHSPCSTWPTTHCAPHLLYCCCVIWSTCAVLCYGRGLFSTAACCGQAHATSALRRPLRSG